MKKLALGCLALISVQSLASISFKKGDTLSVSTYALNYHVFPEDPAFYTNMPRRIDAAGHFVPDPEILMSYKESGSNNNQYMLSVGQDCYAQTAISFSWGRHYRATSWMNYGFTLGAYYRRTHLIYYQGQPKSMKEFYALEIGTGNQFIPLPMATMEMFYPVSKSMDLGFQVGTNIYLTHMTAGIRYKFGSDDEEISDRKPKEIVASLP